MTASPSNLISRCSGDRELACLAVSFAGFLGAMYFTAGHAASVLAIAFFVVPCLIELAVFRRPPEFARNTRSCIVFFCLIALWAAITLFNYAGFKRLPDGIANIALIAIFMFFIQYVARRFPLQAILLTIAVFVTVNAIASLIVHVATPDAGSLGRLVPLGRGGNAIPGAGGLAAGIIALTAAMADRNSWPLKGKLAAFAAWGLMAVALFLTGSRGPILALAGALAAGFLLRGTRRPLAIAVACLAIWALITAAVLLQEPIRQLLCHNSTADFCRSPDRGAVWHQAFDMIIRHPVLGVSPAFRFDSEWASHPHNGLFGLAMFYGLPVLAAALLALFRVAGLAAALPDGKRKFYIVASLGFILGYMGSDLPNIFAYINMHYIFAWMPLFLLIALSDNVPAAERPGG